MFYACSSINQLDLSNFNTNKVKNMYNMFNGCSSLKELNISNFNFKNVKDMKGMFSRCSPELIKKIEAQQKNIRKEALA